MGKSKDLATLKDSGLSIDGTLTTTSTGTNLTSNSYNVVKIQTDKDDNGSNDDAILQFTTGSSNTVKGELRYDESESMFEIGHGDNQGHIRIDSSGNVNMPSKPMFRIRTAGASSVNGTGNGIDLAGTTYYQSSTLVQVGSHFNVSTGRFTAPVTGYYFLNFSNRVDGVGTDYIYFTIFDGGGSIISRNLTSVNTTYQTLHCSAVWYMSANDYVYVRFNSASDSNVNLDSDGFFSGFLIG